MKSPADCLIEHLAEELSSPRSVNNPGGLGLIVSGRAGESIIEVSDPLGAYTIRLEATDEAQQVTPPAEPGRPEDLGPHGENRQEVCRRIVSAITYGMPVDPVSLPRLVERVDALLRDQTLPQLLERAGALNGFVSDRARGL